ncbi:tenecin-1 [Aethina tumida]|uniref:tenecin-1 n=1 Tax=Aethina tumida TaxID=116153 RepID=UPI00096ADD20|nr:tenecin-1 [Aethina tumida]
MNKLNVFALCLVLSAVVLSTYAKPLVPEEVEDEEYRLDHVGRVKRVTCDLLSLNINILGNGGQLNHSACAAHCLYLKKKGGHCNADGVCVCRK